LGIERPLHLLMRNSCRRPSGPQEGFFARPTPCSPVIVREREREGEDLLHGGFHAVHLTRVALIREEGGMEVPVAKVPKGAISRLCLDPVSWMKRIIFATRCAGRSHPRGLSWAHAGERAEGASAGCGEARRLFGVLGHPDRGRSAFRAQVADLRSVVATAAGVRPPRSGGGPRRRGQSDMREVLHAAQGLGIQELKRAGHILAR